MSEPYLGEIKLAGFGFAPRGWAHCNGQILQINQNQALFALLGITYGGNGQTTFALPDLRGRMPMHANGMPGESGGEVTHTLSPQEMPAHNHGGMLVATDSATTGNPAGAVLGNVPAGGTNIFRTADGSAALHPSSVTTAGGSQAHNNMQPYATLNFIIALQGIFPSRD
jgi:microcystin-dependent protein